MVRFFYIRYRFGLILVFILFACPRVSLSDFQWPQWQVREYLAPDMLNHPMVRDVIQAQDGTVWIGTLGGGITCLRTSNKTTIGPEQGLISRDVRRLCEDRFGGVWVGTAQGISYIYQGQIRNYSSENTPEIHDDSIYSIAIDLQNRVWFGSGLNDLFYCEPLKNASEVPYGIWKRPEYTVSRGNGIYSMRVDAQGCLWMAIQQLGGVKLAPSGVEQEWYFPPLPGQYRAVCDIYPNEDGTYWLQVGGDTWRCKRDSVLEKYSLPVDGTCFTFMGNDFLIGSKSGLFCLHDGQYEGIDLSPEHKRPYIERICPLQDGSLWVGTREGAFQLTHSSWQWLPKETFKAGIAHNALVQTSRGNLYTVDMEGNVYRNQGTSWEFVTGLPEVLKPEANPIQMIMAANSRRIYLHYNVGLSALDDAPESHVVEIPLPADIGGYAGRNRVWVDSTERLWLLYYRGAAYLDGDNWIVLPQAVERENRQVFSMLELGRDHFLFGGRNWLEEWRDGHCQVLQLPESYQSDPSRIIDMVEHDGRVWLALENAGILVWDGKHFQHLHHADGLPEENLACLYSASDGTLWIGSRTYGISSYKNGRWVRYGMREGFPNGRVSVITEDASGTIWAEVEYGGLVYYQPERDPPHLWFEGAPKQFNIGEQGVFSIAARDAWNNTPLTDLVFSWRAVREGKADPEGKWSPFTKASTIITPRYRPGKYRLETRVQDKDRNTSPIVSTEFMVLPPVWQTPAFQIPVGLSLAAAVLFLVLWYRKHRLLRLSEECYRRLVEKDTLTLMVVWDSNNRIIYANENAERVLGASQRHSIDSMLAEENPVQVQRLQEVILALHANPKVPQECRLKTSFLHDPTWIFWFITTRFGESYEQEYVGVGVDITELVKMENSLLQERKSFQEFCDSAQIGIFYLGKDDKVFYMNPAMREIANLEEESNSEPEWYPSDHFLDLIHQARAEGRPVSGKLQGKRAADGSRFYVFLYVVPKNEHIECFALDYTEQRELEKRLTKASVLEQKRLGRDMHDLLLPQLTGIDLFVAQLHALVSKQQALDLNLIEEIQWAIKVAENQARALLQGLSPVEIGNGSLYDALFRLIESYRSVFPSRINLEMENLNYHLDGNTADFAFRIAREACYNALIHAKPNTVIVRVQVLSERIMLEIVDDGEGISAEVLSGKSTGFGLNLMRHYAASLDSTISFSRNPKGGTIVSCQIPLSFRCERVTS